MGEVVRLPEFEPGELVVHDLYGKVRVVERREHLSYLVEFEGPSGAQITVGAEHLSCRGEDGAE